MHEDSRRPEQENESRNRKGGASGEGGAEPVLVSGVVLEHASTLDWRATHGLLPNSHPDRPPHFITHAATHGGLPKSFQV